MKHITLYTLFKYLCILGLFGSCSFFHQFKSLDDHKAIIEDYYKENRDSQSIPIVLDTISGFEWDEVLMAGPYSNLENRRTHLDYDFTILPEGIEFHGRFFLIGLLKDKKAVRYIELESVSIPNEIYQTSKGSGYSIFPRHKSNFVIKRKDEIDQIKSEV